MNGTGDGRGTADPADLAAAGRARRFVEKDMQAPEPITVGNGRCTVLTVRKPGADGPNEDACGVIPFADSSGVLVVSDGAGGQSLGQAASAATVKALEKAIRKDNEEPSLRARILDGIEAANRSIQDIGSGSAATVAVVEFDGDRVRPYHVGDSMIVVVGGRGRVKYQSLPHGPTGYAVEAGLLDEDEALHHDERHFLVNALGSTDMRIEVGPELRLAPRDTVLVASDGLFDNVYLNEIVETIRRGPLEAAAVSLGSRCRERMEKPREGEPSHPDDLTLILYRGLPGRRSKPAAARRDGAG